MKKLFLVTAMVIVSLQLFAQEPIRRPVTQTPAALPPPVDLREVSGIVKDPTGQGAVGATVFLKSDKDSMKVAANEDGVFIFKNVKMATFLITVTGEGYKPSVRKYENNDAVPRLVLDPIELKDDRILLNEATVNGTPSISYRGPDTAVIRAADYKVRPNATVDELLKKVEGVEVGNDGSVTFQGQSVTGAKLNGKDFAGGNLAQTIQNLPAEIVENLQFIDDYGDQAARTGVRDGEPRKILNLTTKADRSVGLTGRATLQAGSQGRYNGQLSLVRINGNQQLSLIGRVQRNITGIASSGADGGGRGPGATGGGGGGGNPGTSFTAAPSLSYRDNWAPNLEVLASLTNNYSDNNSRSQSYGETYSVRGNGTYNRSGTNSSTSKGYNGSFRMDWDINKQNYMQITPTFSTSSSTSNSTSTSDVINFFNPVQHQVTSTINSTTSSNPSYGMTVLYQHIFTKPGRNVSIQTSINRSETNSDRDALNSYRFYANESYNPPFKDSLPHTLIQTRNRNTTFRTSLTYAEPLSKTSRLELNVQMRRSNNVNSALTSNIDDLNGGAITPLHNLDNLFNYNITEYRSSLNYRYTGTKFTLLLGIQAIPIALNGTKLNAGVGQNVETSQSYFMVAPRLTLNYAWSRTERLDLTLNTTTNEPSFNQIQPFTDRTDPLNIVIGNPNLKPSLSNSVNLRYNNYLANSKVSISASVQGSLTNNSVSTNTSQIISLIDTADASKGSKSINQTEYVNINGSHNITGNYSLSKQLNNRRYNLSLNGGVTYGYTNAFSNNVAYHTTSWSFNQRFGPRLQPTDNIEINPYVSYVLTRQYSTTRNAKATSLQTTALAIDGRFYFFKTWQINYSASKNYVSGISASQQKNPLVVNAGFEKEFGTSRFITLTFNVYDVFHQNFFVNQSVSSTGTSYTLSNVDSRYFMVGVRLNFQKWTGRPTGRNGQPSFRRGDGSFIN
ncbi:TonB-dependent receptor [Mucilaginibacter puniceus]